MKINALVISAKDNVAVLTESVNAGQTISSETIELTAREDVGASHKVAIVPIAKGEPVIKYGHPIGVASKAIEPGGWIHTHNLESGEE